MIIDNSDAAGKILERGRLARRVTCLPLDKMNSEAIPTKILDIARKAVGAKNVWRAIDLIEYDNKLDPAMKFIFGGVLVCTDLNTANKVKCNQIWNELVLLISFWGS